LLHRHIPTTTDQGDVAAGETIADLEDGRQGGRARSLHNNAGPGMAQHHRPATHSICYTVHADQAAPPASSSGLSASFALTNNPAPPSGGSAGLAVVSGNAQNAKAYQNFPAPLTVKLTDAGGAPIVSAPVTFRAPAYGASGYFTGGIGTTTVLTDASGMASVGYFTANPVTGSYVVTADANGFQASIGLTNLP